MHNILTAVADFQKMYVQVMFLLDKHPDKQRDRQSDWYYFARIKEQVYGKVIRENYSFYNVFSSALWHLLTFYGDFILIWLKKKIQVISNSHSHLSRFFLASKTNAMFVQITSTVNCNAFSSIVVHKDTIVLQDSSSALCSWPQSLSLRTATRDNCSFIQLLS